MNGAGLLSGVNSLRGDQILNLVLKPRDMVLMSLYNNHPEILGKGKPKQRPAVRIIETIVDAHFAKKKREQQS